MDKTRRILLLGLAAALISFATPAAQRLTVAAPLRQFVKVDAPVVAITHVRVVDGTGAPPRENQTLLIRDGNISVMGAAASVAVPDGATVIDATGKTVI